MVGQNPAVLVCLAGPLLAALLSLLLSHARAQHAVNLATMAALALVALGIVLRPPMRSLLARC